MKIMQNSLQYSLLNFVGEDSNTQLENRCGVERERNVLAQTEVKEDCS